MTQPTPSRVGAGRQRLFVRLGDGIDFARYDARQPESFSFFAYDVNPTASLAVNLRTALDTLPPADNTVTDAQVLVAASPVTLVPLAHFREEDCAALYGYCFPESQGCEVYYDVLPMANAVLLFALQRQLARTLEDAFGSVHYVSALTPLMRHFADKSSQGGQRLYAYAAEGRLHLSVFEGGRLLMANSYRMQAPTDAAYYLLNMARRTGTDPQTATFYVAGSGDLRDAILGELRKYVRQVNAIHPAGSFSGGADNSAVFAEARAVARDIARALSAIAEGRVEELHKACLPVEQALQRGIQGLLHPLGRGLCAHGGPALGQGVYPAAPALRGAQWRAGVEPAAQIPGPVPGPVRRAAYPRGRGQQSRCAARVLPKA